MPLVSVIIPNYNHAPFLRQRIDSVINQKYQDIEVIILDDCSTDRSKDIIEEYRGHVKVKNISYNDVNTKSTFRQWNKGVQLSRGDIIWIAESDDFADPDFLSVLIPPMLNDEKIGIAYSQSFQVNDKNEIVRNYKVFTDDLSVTQFENDFCLTGTEYVKKFLIHKNTIPNASGVVFRKKFYQQAGGADPDIKYCSDWLTWLKILLISDVFFVAQPKNYFRFHEQSVIARAVSENVSEKNYVAPARVMRKKLAGYMRDHLPAGSEVSKLNADYLHSDYGNEGMFYIRNRSWVNGWSSILKSMWSADFRLHYVKAGLRQSLKTILGLT